MPPLSRLLPTPRSTHGAHGDQIRAEQLDSTLVPIAPEHSIAVDQHSSYGSQATVHSSYHVHGMVLPQTSESRRRIETTKKKEKSMPSRSHTRSFSHFFGGSRKKVLGVDSDTDSSDDDGFGISSNGSSSASKGKRALSARDDEPSFEMGLCMTCNSKVRWPKGLKLYRCTVCHCVNDLEPRPPKELRKVKDVDQATWRRLNAHYPRLKFPDARKSTLSLILADG